MQSKKQHPVLFKSLWYKKKGKVTSRYQNNKNKQKTIKTTLYETLLNIKVVCEIVCKMLKYMTSCVELP